MTSSSYPFKVYSLTPGHSCNYLQCQWYNAEKYKWLHSMNFYSDNEMKCNLSRASMFVCRSTCYGSSEDQNLFGHMFVKNWKYKYLRCACWVKIHQAHVIGIDPIHKSCSTSHNDPFRTEICTFLFWMEHYGVCNRWILSLWNWFIVSYFPALLTVYHSKSTTRHTLNFP